MVGVRWSQRRQGDQSKLKALFGVSVCVCRAQWLMEPFDTISALWKPRSTCSDKMIVELTTHNMGKP